MDEKEFQTLLEQYPVVRKKTHMRVEWNPLKDDDSNATGPAHTELMTASIDPEDSFQTALSKFLEPYFTASELPRVLRAFEQSQESFIAGLCLEDINDVCVNLTTN